MINYTRLDVPWTRVLEHKHFAPWESHCRTLVSREFSKETEDCDTPCYPKRLGIDRQVLQRYLAKAGTDPGVSFIGRLGTYRYLGMHQVIAESLELSRAWLKARSRGKKET